MVSIIFWATYRDNSKGQNTNEDIKQKTESQLKDILINRNLYVGKIISAAKNELDRRGLSLTDSERQQQEANHKARIQETKKDITNSNNNWFARLFRK